MYDELVALLRKKYDKAPMVMEAADAIESLKREYCGSDPLDAAAGAAGVPKAGSFASTRHQTSEGDRA